MRIDILIEIDPFCNKARFGFYLGCFGQNGSFRFLPGPFRPKWFVSVIIVTGGVCPPKRRAWEAKPPSLESVC